MKYNLSAEIKAHLENEHSKMLKQKGLKKWTYQF
jgi:hypothetical protein